MQDKVSEEIGWVEGRTQKKELSSMGRSRVKESVLKKHT